MANGGFGSLMATALWEGGRNPVGVEYVICSFTQGSSFLRLRLAAARRVRLRLAAARRVRLRLAAARRVRLRLAAARRVAILGFDAQSLLGLSFEKTTPFRIHHTDFSVARFVQNEEVTAALHERMAWKLLTLYRFHRRSNSGDETAVKCNVDL